MSPRAFIPLVYLLAGLLVAMVGVSWFRDEGLGTYAPLALALGTGLVGIAGGVLTRHRWQDQRRGDDDEKRPP